MYTIIILVVITVIFTVYSVYKDDWADLEDYLILTILSVFVSMIIAFFIAWSLPMDTYNKKYNYEIENLQDNSSLQGSFFLGIGSIDGEMKYSFYYKDGNSFRMMQIPVDKASIKYSNDAPRVFITENYPSDNFINRFAIDMDLFDKTYVIEVPKGTIQNNYNLDAQ